MKEFHIPRLYIDEEILNPKTYLKLCQEDKRKIRQTEIIPPKLGESGFGKVRVKYSSAILNYLKNYGFNSSGFS